MTATAARPQHIDQRGALRPNLPSGHQHDPAAAPIPPAATDPQVADLVRRCRTGLQVAGNATTATERFATSHLAALRAAAAVLAACPLPSRRTRLRSVWDIVPLVAPDLSEWCQFFSATARRRAAAERGSIQISAREADDLMRQAGLFLEAVTARLGLPPQPPATPWLRPVVG